MLSSDNKLYFQDKNFSPAWSIGTLKIGLLMTLLKFFACLRSPPLSSNSNKSLSILAKVRNEGLFDWLWISLLVAKQNRQQCRPKIYYIYNNNIIYIIIISF